MHDNPEDVQIIDAEIDTDYHPTAYYEALREKNSNPLIFFRKIRGHPDFSLVENTFGSRERIAYILNTRVEKLYDAFNDIYANQKQAEIITEATQVPVKERIFKGSSASLFDLPVPKHYLDDGANTGHGRYIDAGLILSRDPVRQDILNLSYARIQLLSDNKFSISMHSRGNLYNHYQFVRRSGKSLQISVIIGGHPLLYLAAASRIEDEYSKVNRLVALNLVRGETNDLPIPSESEIVIEAEISPVETFEEGPFSEYTGYMSGRSTKNVAKVKCILRKKTAIFVDIVPSNSPEHILLASIPKEARYYKTVSDFLQIGGGFRVDWPVSGSQYMAFCSIREPIPGMAKQLALALLGLDHYLKIVFVNEGQIELNLERLLVNLAVTGVVAGQNIEILSDVYCNRLDPSASTEGTVGKIMLVSKGTSVDYRRIVENPHRVKLVAGQHQVILSHTYTEVGDLNLILDEDIDLDNVENIVWALATRYRPDKDTSFRKGRMILQPSKRNFSSEIKVPKLPADLIETVKNSLSS